MENTEEMKAKKKAAQRLTLVELKNICEGGKAFVAERGVDEKYQYADF